MTVGELVYQKAIEAGYDPHLATGLVPSLEKALGSYKRIFEDLREPMKTVSSAVESLKPQLDAVNRISFPTIPTYPAITEYAEDDEDDSYFPSLIQPVQDVRITNLEDILGVTQKQESDLSVVSYHLPQNATWESLDIQFLDGHFVKISYPNMKSQKFDYKDMGFVNMKTTNPDRKWELLRTIAENNGALTNAAEIGFAQDMSIHHQQAIEMSFIIQEKTDDQDIRGFAFDVINTQANQRGMMLGWLDLWQQPLTTTETPMEWMMSDMQSTKHNQIMNNFTSGAYMPGMASNTEMNGLRNAAGQNAEQLFLKLMIRHHQGGVMMAEGVIQRSDNEVVTRLAQTMVNGQQAEINYMNELLVKY